MLRSSSFLHRFEFAIAIILPILFCGGCGPASHISTAPSANSVLPAYPTPTAAGAISFSAGTYTPIQNAGSFTFAVYRNSGSTGAVSVQYNTADGTALAGTDYTAASGTLSWSDGDSSVKSVSVPFLNTTAYSGTKQFSINLSNPTGGAVLNNFLTTFVTVTDNLTPPSKNFSFNGWKLTLPTDIYGGTGGTNNIQFEAQTVTAATLNAGFSDPYFYLNTANQIVFTTPANGAVTTPGTGSDHTRSELRELYTGAGADSNSDWNSAIGGTLTGAVQVVSVASTSDEATIGQIHGQNNAFVILMYRPGSTDIAVQLYPTPTATTSTRTSILTGVALNDKITYTIDHHGNTVTITVNDTTKSTSKVMTFDVTPWANSPEYFKIGAYHAAPNSGSPTSAQTQVLVTSFSVSH